LYLSISITIASSCDIYDYISIFIKYPIVDWRTCRWTGEEFVIYQQYIDLLDKISSMIENTKYLFLLSTLSPEARMRRRMMFE